MSNLDPRLIRNDFPFESRYLTVNSHKLHYIDQGSGDPVLFLHGNPTWSYTWRNILPYFGDDVRTIAVDNIGMGRSDKPAIDYTFLEHADYISQFIEHLELEKVTLVGHDWGAALGLHYAAKYPEKIKGIVLLEPQALVPSADWSGFSPQEAVELFQKLRDPELGWPFMRDHSIFIEGMTHTIINRQITAEELDMYREPFMNPDTRRPMWKFPNQIPIEGKPDEVKQAVLKRNEWLTASLIPKLLIYATPGCNVREPQLEWCRTHLQNLTLVPIGTGFHHLTEENPHAVGQEMLRWFRQIQ
ncbi:haloalkane dehalogenase [Paenibacillus sp. sgz500958]|uniref:haloalkane dehalogenase n=1 Tax=Paenibacillus sp. sgz500958 TaxID=3242475 RepID=UPI0036D3C579